MARNQAAKTAAKTAAKAPAKRAPRPSRAKAAPTLALVAKGAVKLREDLAAVMVGAPTAQLPELQHAYNHLREAARPLDVLDGDTRRQG